LKQSSNHFGYCSAFLFFRYPATQYHFRPTQFYEMIYPTRSQRFLAEPAFWHLLPVKYTQIILPIDSSIKI